MASMEADMMKVESLLNYKFKSRYLLEAAFTHRSCPDATSYERLEFAGDAVLQILLTNHLILAYPHLDPGDLSLLRSANVTTEKLARVAVRNNLYQYVRRNAPVLDEKVRNFTLAIQGESEETAYWSHLKAPKILADIVESIAAAIYIDCDFDLKAVWVVFRVLLEPMVTKETLQHQPVSALYEFCHKNGMEVDIEHHKEDSTSLIHVYIDKQLVCSALSQNKEIAKITAAKRSLKILTEALEAEMHVTENGQINHVNVKEHAKQKLYQFCNKKFLSKPFYRVDKEEGPVHEKQYICSVEVEGPSCVYVAQGESKSKLREAESSAASRLLAGLLADDNLF